MFNNRYCVECLSKSNSERQSRRKYRKWYYLSNEPRSSYSRFLQYLQAIYTRFVQGLLSRCSVISSYLVFRIFPGSKSYELSDRSDWERLSDCSSSGSNIILFKATSWSSPEECLPQPFLQPSNNSFRNTHKDQWTMSAATASIVYPRINFDRSLPVWSEVSASAGGDVLGAPVVMLFDKIAGGENTVMVLLPSIELGSAAVTWFVCNRDSSAVEYLETIATIVKIRKRFIDAIVCANLMLIYNVRPESLGLLIPLNVLFL